MKQTVLSNNTELANIVAAKIEEVIRNKPDALICLCAGASPVLIIKKLVEDAKAGLYPDDKFKFVSLDEWVGLGIGDAGSCIYDLTKLFLEPLGIGEGERLCFFNGLSNDLDGECAKASEFIKKNGGIDVILLGIGMNGHIGFNEPGSKATDSVRIIDLSEISKTVSKKYFDRPHKLEKGITLGLKEIIEAKKILLIASGAHKRDIVQETVCSEMSESCPSTLLQKHQDIEIFLDADAAIKI
jgi:glucosamine-6-phosphate isomerase